MTTTILLIRHALHGHAGHILTGRMKGVELTVEGQEQARSLGRRLQAEPLAAVHSSPALRTRRTADEVARLHGVEVEAVDALAEVDFGEWTGRTFAELEGDIRWHVWNNQRASARAPGGESMAEVQRRAWSHLTTMANSFAGAVVAVVSHCDVIRAVIAKVLGLSLDHLLRFDIEPASISRIAMGNWGARVATINECNA